MARQAGPIYLTGTIDDITYYKMEGEYLARKKSSLDRKQFRTDPRFARSRKSAEKFGEASTLASEIYHHLPKEAKKKGAFGKLTKQVGDMMRVGKGIDEIKETLSKTNHQELVAISKTTEATPPTNRTTPVVLPQSIQVPIVRGPKPAVAKPILHLKKARYLSSWKVKRNGRLHIPRNVSAYYLLYEGTNGER